MASGSRNEPREARRSGECFKNEIKKYLLVYILTNPADISFILFFEAEKGIFRVLSRGLNPLP